MDTTIIDEAGDLILEVTQRCDIGPSKSARFKVNREILKKVSQVFLSMLVGGHWKESDQTVVSLGEGHIAVTEVWLRVVHGIQLVYNLLFPELWQLIEAIDYFALDVTKFNAWFATWYTQQTLSFSPAEMMFPSWRFDHAKLFARCTHDLAYHRTGCIMEGNPSTLFSYHLPARILQQLNAAKGRLRTVLFRGLWSPCDRLFKSGCACRKETLFDYQNHLYSINVWPLETVFLKCSIYEILCRLERFSYKARPKACTRCQQNYQMIVVQVCSQVREYFQGLCLDCLDRSKPKTGDIDMDYWVHDKLSEHETVRGCRIEHKQPTWYFSFNGRREERDRLVKMRESDRHNEYLYPDSHEEDATG